MFSLKTVAAKDLVFTPNTPWSHKSGSRRSPPPSKLEWNDGQHAFTLPKTGEDLRTLTERLLREQTAETPDLTLA